MIDETLVESINRVMREVHRVPLSGPLVVSEREARAMLAWAIEHDSPERAELQRIVDEIDRQRAYPMASLGDAIRNLDSIRDRSAARRHFLGFLRDKRTRKANRRAMKARLGKTHAKGRPL